MRSGEMVDRTGMTGEKIKVPNLKKVFRSGSPRKMLVTVAVIGAVLAVIAVILAPANDTSATPGRTGGNCGNCHPLETTPFLTVDGFPTSYVPGGVYTITISVADTNGLTVGSNSFDIILSAGGGTVVGVNQYVKNVSALEVATNEVFNETVAQWTVKWTAPTSGTVTVNTWASLGQAREGTLRISS